MNDRRKNKILSAAYARQPDMTVLLENIQDNHNFGAVLRSADAVGVSSVYLLHHGILPKGHKPFVLGKKSSMGARKWVDVHMFSDVKNTIQLLKSQYGRLLAAVPDASDSKPLQTMDFTTPFALVFGNETGGLTDEMIAACDECFFIPQYGMAESLNLSVACAVTLYEVLRQRQQAGFYSPEYEPFLSFRKTLADKYLVLGDSKLYPLDVFPEDMDMGQL
jgi:tRNA (guanosine-2'-O-)-methyltransferase